MTREISRRRFLTIAGLGLGAVVLEACAVLPTATATPDITKTVVPTSTPDQVLINKAVEATIVARNATPTPTATPGLEAVRAEFKDIQTKIAQIEPTVTPTEIPMVKVGGISVFGIPAKPQGEVDIAKGKFRNETGLANFILAEPGGVLMGADASDTTAKDNRYAKEGKNPGADTIYGSGGSINFWNPITQEVLSTQEASFNLPEGGFRLISMGEGRITIPRDSKNSDPNMREFILQLPFEVGNNYIVLVRGLYNDSKQDSDRNRSLKITKHVPGHAMTAMYSSRDDSNLGFISEEHMMQIIATSHLGGTNCGAEGCSRTTIVALDTNTGKLEISTQVMDRERAKDWKNVAKTPFKKEFSN